MAKQINVLNLGGRSKHTSTSSGSSSSEDEGTPNPPSKGQPVLSESESDDEEFEIPPGFERIQGDSTLTRESILPEQKELWFFKLPKHVCELVIYVTHICSHFITSIVRCLRIRQRII